MQTDNLGVAIQTGELSRQDFIQYCLMISSILSLPVTDFEKVFLALSTPPRKPVVWLEFTEQSYIEPFSQDGLNFRRHISDVNDLKAFETLKHFISLDYHKNVSPLDDQKLNKYLLEHYDFSRGEYICVLASLNPQISFNEANDAFSETPDPIIRAFASNAKATIALHPCFSEREGDVVSYSTNQQNVRPFPWLKNQLNLPGCPADAVNIAAAIVYIITYGEPPAVNENGRPHYLFNPDLDDTSEFDSTNEPVGDDMREIDDASGECDCLNVIRCNSSESQKRP
jgi:Ni,Fe-hydrogenase I small subunit